MLTTEQRRTRRGLLADIRENPDDDTLRLIFADWLEDHGEEGELDWARLIRVQIERSARGLTECVNRSGSLRPVFVCEGPDWMKLTTRRCEYCRLTVEQERVFWTWQVRGPNSFLVNNHMCWSRGFIHKVKGIEFEFWRRCGPQICREHPVERVELHNVDGYVFGSQGEWGSYFGQFPVWFADYYKTRSIPFRKDRQEAIDHINRILLDWGRSEAVKLDAEEAAS